MKLVQAVNDLQDVIEQQAERIDELEDELSNLKQHNGREHAQLNQRISGIEEQNQEAEARSGDASPEGDGEETGSQKIETPLERICALPEHIADRELTANQERARFIAKDIRDYAEKAPAGLVINSRAIKRVLTAKEGSRPHTQTVARVMDFLADLGEDDVELTKRRGTKLIAVDPDAADQLKNAANHTRCDRGSGATTNGSVIGAT